MATILAWLRAQPLWLRTAVGTFVQTAIAAILVLNLVIPNSVASAEKEGVVVGLAILGAAIATAKAAVPGFLAWFFALIGTPPPTWLKS